MTRRCEILNSDLSLWRPDVPLIDGSVTVDASRDERRAFAATVGFRGLGTTEMYVDPTSLWHDKIVRLWRGVTTPDLDWECVLGTFMIDLAEVQHMPNTFDLTGRDFTKKMLLSKLTGPTTYAAGTKLDDLIKAQAANAGITKVVLPWDTENPAPVLAVDTTFDTAATRWEIVKTSCLGFNYEVYFDRHGWLIVRTFQDPYLTAPLWTFQTGHGVGNLISWKKSTSDARLFNHVLVLGGDDASVPITAEAEITDTSHPAHKDRIGDRLMDPIEAVTATTPELAQALADSQLKFASLEEYNISMSSIVIPWLDAADIIKFIDPDPTAEHDPTTFFQHDFSIPLGLAPMDVNADRVVLVS